MSRNSGREVGWPTPPRHAAACLRPPLPPRHSRHSWLTRRLIGRAAHELGEWQQAELAYRKALDVQPNCVAAWTGLARLFAASGNAVGAVEANEKVVRVLFTLLLMIWRQGRSCCHGCLSRCGLQWVRLSQPAPNCCPVQLSLLPEEDPSHQQHELCLADAYNRCGRYQEAARQYRQLLAHADDEGAEEAPLPETRVELLCRLADIQVGGRSRRHWRQSACGRCPDSNAALAIHGWLDHPDRPPPLSVSAAEAG